MSNRVAFRAPNRGDIHPGLLMAGVLVALAVAWWFARSDPATASRTRSGVAAPVVAPGSAAPPARGGNGTAAAGHGPEKPLYRWTDAAGVVHFTDVPPADRPYVEVDVDPERNVVRSPAEP